MTKPNFTTKEAHMEHSIEELRKKVDAARQLWLLQEQKYLTAKEDLWGGLRQRALDEYAAQGITPGTKVRFIPKNISNKRDYIFTGIIGRSELRPQPALSKIKKDGTPYADYVRWLPEGEIVPVGETK